MRFAAPSSSVQYTSKLIRQDVVADASLTLPGTLIDHAIMLQAADIVTDGSVNIDRQATALAIANRVYTAFDDVSLTDAEVFNYAELLGPKQITDRYLLALAVRNNGRLVTFDQGIRLTAVTGAAAEHLIQLPG